jgi:hypothetical protein
VRKLFFSLLAICGIFLAGCTVITDGDIGNKEFIPAHEESTLTMDIEGNPHFNSDFVPDRWFLTIQKVDEKNGGFLIRRVQVDRETYNRVQLGEYFSIE